MCVCVHLDTHTQMHAHTHRRTLHAACPHCSVTRSTLGACGWGAKLWEAEGAGAAGEVDTGISRAGFSCGVHLVGRVGNSCRRPTKVSLLGLTVSVSVQRKESILLEYGCALGVKQQTGSVWHASRWFVAEPLVWSVSRSCRVTALCSSPPPGPPEAPSRPAWLWCLILYSGTEAEVPPYSYLSLNKSHLERRLQGAIRALTKDRRDKVQARDCNYNKTKIFRERDTQRLWGRDKMSLETAALASLFRLRSFPAPLSPRPPPHLPPFILVALFVLSRIQGITGALLECSLKQIMLTSYF